MVPENNTEHIKDQVNKLADCVADLARHHRQLKETVEAVEKKLNGAIASLGR
jgi:hypothetical protein